jgi:hypothetical protein
LQYRDTTFQHPDQLLEALAGAADLGARAIDDGRSRAAQHELFSEPPGLEPAATVLGLRRVLESEIDPRCLALGAASTYSLVSHLRMLRDVLPLTGDEIASLLPQHSKGEASAFELLRQEVPDLSARWNRWLIQPANSEGLVVAAPYEQHSQWAVIACRGIVGALSTPESAHVA